MTELRTFLTFLAPPNREDEVGGWLALAQCAGWQTREEAGNLRIDADFPGASAADLAPLIARIVAEVPGSNPHLHVDSPQPDWIAESARGLSPFAVGDKFWVDPSPREEGGLFDSGKEPPPRDRILLRIAPERAFGTGTHESTRLVLEWIDRNPPVGKRVLDVGTGSAILAMAAHSLGARRVTAFDNDPEAVFCARRNLPVPRLSKERGVGLFAGTIDAIGAASFDVVLANIVPEVLVILMPAFRLRVRTGGSLVLAGILRESAGAVSDAAARNGFGQISVHGLGEWVAIEAVRT